MTSEIMIRRRPLSRFLKTNSVIKALALLAMIVSALAPNGFMPVQTAHGFAIEFCSGHADSKLEISPDHPDYELLALVYGQKNKPAPEKETESGSSACAFAGGTSVGLAATAPDFAVGALVPANHQPSEPRRFVLRNRINIPPATGPPVTL